MRKSRLVLPLSLGALAFAACSGEKNYDERRQAPEAAAPVDTTDEAAMKAACIGACAPDPGSKAVDIAKAEAGAEFAWVWDLRSSLDGGESKATATYTYDDNTSELAVPLKAQSMVGSGRGGWEPTPDPVPGDLPGPKLAIRFKGGPFTEYGGGFGQSFLTVANTPARIPALADSRSTEFPSDAGGAYDLRTWDGIAIWARRGPDGQATLRLGITERNSAEDLNSGAMAAEGAVGVNEGKYCRRWRVCGCSGGTECINVEPGGVPDYRCVDPAITVLPESKDQIAFPPCGETRCRQGNPSRATPQLGDDPLYSKEQGDGTVVSRCTPAVTSDGRSDSYCYDPAIDPLPPGKRERCNNPFSYPIRVTTDWQLIKVPFSELRQADEGNVADEMDLASVKQLVVTHGAGWTDFWIANLGFYRKK
jgi:hypothetical protein